MYENYMSTNLTTIKDANLIKQLQNYFNVTTTTLIEKITLIATGALHVKINDDNYYSELYLDSDGYSKLNLSNNDVLFNSLKPLEDGVSVFISVIYRKLDENPLVSAPVFISSEIGNTDASTINVYFDMPLSASDFSSGVTIWLNDVVQDILSATLSIDGLSVAYVFDDVAISTDTLYWAYEKLSGNIVSDGFGTALQDVSPRTVVNNI